MTCSPMIRHLVDIMLLRRCFAHLEILVFPMVGNRGIFAWFKTMRRKQHLASALGI